MHDRFRTIQVVITGALVVSGVGLVAMEMRRPGFCPTYPVLDIPACYVMGLLFLWMFIANFIEQRRAEIAIYFGSGLLALTSSTFFSTQAFLGVGYCPEVFGIPLPLCFVVPPVLIASLYLKAIGLR